jgi:AcrR family transcriptional regulator
MADPLDSAPVRAGYRRSSGTPRAEAKRRELLELVTGDLAANGLVDFSLRRAARAAGTTHKVLLYHFDGVDDLLTQAIVALRERRIGNAVNAMNATAVMAGAGEGSLADRVRAIWPVLISAESGLRVLDQAIGLAMYDPARYRELGREASAQYLPVLLSLCPASWPESRKHEISQLILATMRGMLIDWLTTGDTAGSDAALVALARALEHEEAMDSV